METRLRPYKPDQIRIEEMHDWYRANCECICDICGCKYYDHQPVTGFTWLLKLCNGDLVKF